MELDVMYCESWNPWFYEGIEPVTEERANAMFHTDKRNFTVTAVCGTPGFYDRKEQPLFTIGTSKNGAQISILNKAGSDTQTYSYSNRRDDAMFLFGYTRYYYNNPEKYSMSPNADRRERWGISDDGTYESATLVPGVETDWGPVHTGLDTAVLWRPRVVFGRWRELTVVGMIEPAVPGFVGMDWPDAVVDEHGRASVDTSGDVIHVKNFPDAKGMLKQKSRT
ncbi:hypothetical protein [Tsukamurella tyrosinosolvens]|uniref:hypothetical protein n=1 Tax=Tsukamurella tyrosinosolvens TaxID=57704 RepID=UPI002DD42854|nr:hypothetical protein [Tsukamurella tyrosinosolvens]MEC4615191.1 hypothetical protein [Tsukamurella tyrosinosolvens]